MTKMETLAQAFEPLHKLAARLEAARGFSAVLDRLTDGRRASLDGVWGSSCALVAAALARSSPGPVVIVCAHQNQVDDFYDDLRVFTAATTETFPAWESAPDEARLDDEIYGDRLRLLKNLGGPTPPKLIVTCIQSLLQPVPGKGTLAQQTLRLAIGNTVSTTEIANWLAERSFHGSTAVQLPGEFALRGGILDVFAPDWYNPVRIEFYGDTIESIRQFEVASQRSLSSLDSVEITVFSPELVANEQFFHHLPDESWLLLVEPHELLEEGQHYVERQSRPGQVHPIADTLKQVQQFAHVSAESIARGGATTTCRLQIESVERFSGDIEKVRDELEAVGTGQRIHVVCETEAEAERLGNLFSSTELAKSGQLRFPIGRLKHGFRLVGERIALVSSAELFHRSDLTRRSRRRMGRVIDSFLALREGDLVVHLAHGVGRYRGMALLGDEGNAEEHLELEFHGGTKIYVPSSKIDLVQKYVGGPRAKKNALAKIGSKAWAKQKEAAEAAVADLATEMIELQAMRASRPGIGYPADSEWQREFDASFPYRETPDQLAALSAIKSDMQRPQPMDRLLCGDVGFGKTEVAIRAAFKAVDAGFQVAVLVPTTVLANQHLRTFQGRMAEFPFSIASLSRFCSGSEQRKVLEGMKDGLLDIVIGTHRLAQADIQFQNLGLLVIDEEQRFGVEIKERLKALRQVVDVLTLTATPIPRTLQMSLLGVREISNLETPPEDRVAVETHVSRFDADLIRHAVLRELNRDGQVFFVHNRVQDIQKVAERLAAIIPEARIGIGHGQMPAAELEQVMLDFMEQKYDVLLATTIVESGLDIPNANTIFIDDADRYGLADLHQLRGRVGRYKHRAYCYLLLNPNRHISNDSARRLRAIEEYSEMGAGFAIAMRDLELRGAGNLLGNQQSGHIANVGYELYCSLLEGAVRKLRKLPPKESISVNIELPADGYLPEDYVPDQRLKIDLYRRLTRITNEEDLAEFRDELADRFGPRPEPVDQLIRLTELRILANRWRVTSILREDDFIVLRFLSRSLIQKLASQTKQLLRIVDDQSAYLPMKGELSDTNHVLERLKSVLQP